MTSHEFVDLLFLDGMQILELVNGREFLDIETVGQHAIGFSLEQMLGLEGGDVGDCGEDIGGVSRCALYAVSMIDPSLSCFCVHIEELQIVVEVDRAGAEVSSKEGGVGSEDGGDVHLSFLGQGKGDTGEPFVKVGDDSTVSFAGDVLQMLV
jgi:hypothetical protein